jgi:hypothetical protein
MDVENIRAGKYISITIQDPNTKIESFIIVVINNYIRDLIDRTKGSVQVTAKYPPNQLFINRSIDFKDLVKYQAKDVYWTNTEKLMKLLY